MEQFTFSFFTNCRAIIPAENITLFQFIERIKSDQYKQQIEALRATQGEAEQKKLKQSLPAATVSGIFSHRKADRLTNHSLIICLDFDALHAPGEFKGKVCALPFVLAAFISPRGNGCKVLVHIDGNDHKGSFISLRDRLKAITGEDADESGKDVCRLCFVSYDPEAYLNPSAQLYRPEAAMFVEMEPIRSQEPEKKAPESEKQDSQETEVLKLIEKIEAAAIDIAPDYDTWLKKVVFPFAHFFGVSGIGYLHRVSRFSLKYDPTATDQQFKEALKHRGTGRKIESFFQLCKENKIFAREPGKAIEKAALTSKFQGDERRKPTIVQVEEFLSARFDFRRNTVNEKVEFKEKKSTRWQEVSENAISRLLEHNFFNYGPNKTAALLYSDWVNTHNPFVEYFESLIYSHDEGSYIDKVCKVVKVKDQDRFNRHFKKMLVRCVACSMVEEKTNSRFNKHIFTLVSPRQSVGKTSFTRWLCPPALQDYYTETFDSSKDGKISLSTMFIINLDELASLAKHDINQLKAMVSLASINERLPYGKHRQFYPRRANFFGSTNNDEFLTDTTGNVRWLCFEVESFEPDFWKPGSPNYIEINKVWAEAKHLYDKGEPYQLTADERGENEESNQKHQKRTIEEEMILNYCEPDEARNKENHKTATQVAEYLAVQSSLGQKISRDNVGRALSFLGYERVNIKKLGQSIPGYFIVFKK